MSEATIKFEREGREGIVPVGTYLADAARRLGIRFEEKCDQGVNEHFCGITVVEGSEFLSDRTSAETEKLADTNGTGERLSCQARITAPGEIVLMTNEPKEEAKKEEAPASETYAKEFAEMPLEKKFAELVHLEAMALSETLSFVMNSPYLIFDKVMDVMAEFGLRKEQEGKRSARPAEHIQSDEQAAGGDETSIDEVVEAVPVDESVGADKEEK